MKNELAFKYAELVFLYSKICLFTVFYYRSKLQKSRKIAIYGFFASKINLRQLILPEFLRSQANCYLKNQFHAQNGVSLRMRALRHAHL